MATNANDSRHAQHLCAHAARQLYTPDHTSCRTDATQAWHRDGPVITARLRVCVCGCVCGCVCVCVYLKKKKKDEEEEEDEDEDLHQRGDNYKESNNKT